MKAPHTYSGPYDECSECGNKPRNADPAGCPQRGEATLEDWLLLLGAYEAEMGICCKIEIDSFRWILLSKTCRDPDDKDNEWCEPPTSLDEPGIATVWHAGQEDEPVVTMHGKIRDLLPMIGCATQVSHFFDEDDVEHPTGDECPVACIADEGLAELDALQNGGPSWTEHVGCVQCGQDVLPESTINSPLGPLCEGCSRR